MSGYVSAQVPIKVTKADGTFFWSGVGRLGVVHNCVNTDGGAVKTVADGDGIELIIASAIIPRTDYTAADVAGGTLPPADSLVVQRSATTGVMLGASLEPAPLGAVFQVAGHGSIFAVRSTGALTPLSTSVGMAVASATQGVLAGGTSTLTAATNLNGKVLGPVLQATITGGTGQRSGVYISPS